MKKTKTLLGNSLQQRNFLFIILCVVGIGGLVLITENPLAPFFVKPDTQAVRNSPEPYVEPAPVHFSSEELGVAFDYLGTLEVKDVAPITPNTSSQLPFNISTPGITTSVVGGEYSLSLFRYKNASAKKVSSQIQTFFAPQIEKAKKYILEYSQTASDDESKTKILATLSELTANQRSGRYGTFVEHTFEDANGKRIPAYRGSAVTEYHEYFIKNFHEKYFLILQDGADVLVIEYPLEYFKSAETVLNTLEIL